MLKFNEFLKIKEAAAFIGVTPSTLRNWEKDGKISSYRNPVNNWRLYNKEELVKLLDNIKPIKGNIGTLEEAAQAE